MKDLLTAKEDFAARLLIWFAGAGRPLPWRAAYDPYQVWISEIMLQQTQAERGARYFEAWMRRFPDIRSVAEADEAAVLTAWEGLGYYSRARNLHRAAKYILDVHHGEFPASVELIRALPGVGEYTAGAVASIAFNQPEPAVDANVRRLLARLGDLARPVDEPETQALITATARALIPAESPRLFNQALMELGALVCARKPGCGRCPVTAHCAAHKRGTTAERPMVRAKAAYQFLETAAGVVRRDGLILIRQRPLRGLWAGLWDFPGGPVEPGESPEGAVVRHVREQTGLEVAVGEKITVVRHGYTTRRATLHGFFGESQKTSPVADGLWVRPEDLADRAFPAGARKLLEYLGWK